MNIERAAMKGKLAGLQESQKHLTLRIEGNARSICQELNTALTPVDDLPVPMIAAQMDELVMAWAELQKVLSDINRIERELK